MQGSMQSTSPSEEFSCQIAHYKPDAWLGKHWWDETQNVPIASSKVKRAACQLVWVEHFKDGVGWLLLLHFGVLVFLLKTFPVELFWLAWGIFLLEALLKFGRRWARDHYFRGVPCAYIALNKSAALNSVTFLGQVTVLATVAELGLYLPYLLIGITKIHDYEDDDGFARRGLFFDSDDPFSKARTNQLLIASCVVVLLHWAASLASCLTFLATMGVSSLAFPMEKVKNVDDDKISSCTDREMEQLLCLTWWLHLVRHPFLSASVASAQPRKCGLQGQWFETVTSLKKILEDSTNQSKRSVSSDSSTGSGSLWVSQDMAMRALSNFSKHGSIDSCRSILDENGLLLLILIVEEGNPVYCKGLAASTIGTLVQRGCFDGEELANLSDAIPALQKLVRSEDSDLKEMAIGALLNITLNSNHGQQEVAVDEMLASPDQSIHVPEESVSSRVFVESLLGIAHQGATMRCRVLASGLLACLASKKKVRDVILGAPGNDYIAIFSRSLRNGATLEVKRSAAGLLWELASWEPMAVGSGQSGERCLKSLVGALKQSGEPSVAAAAAGALASLAADNEDLKQMIMNEDGCVEALIEQLRGKLMWRLSNHLLEVYGIVYNKVQEQVQVQAARALGILATDSTKNQDYIARKGAIPEIVKLLTVRNPYVQLQAAAALDAIAYKNKSIQDLVGLYYREAFLNLAELLSPDRPDVPPELLDVLLEKAAMAVRSLAEGHPANAEKVVGSGAIDQLTAILERDTEVKYAHGKLCEVVLEALAHAKGSSRRSSASISARKSSAPMMPGAPAPPTSADITQLHSLSQDMDLSYV